MTLEKDVRILLEEGGGFAGIKMPGIALTSADLSDADAAEFQKLFEQADLSGLPPVPAPPASMRDAIQTKLTVTVDGRQNIVRVNEGDTPEGVQRLIDWIKRHRE